MAAAAAGQQRQDSSSSKRSSVAAPECAPWLIWPLEKKARLPRPRSMLLHRLLWQPAQAERVGRAAANWAQAHLLGYVDCRHVGAAAIAWHSLHLHSRCR